MADLGQLHDEKNAMMKKLAIIVIMVIALSVALAEMPYGYYQVLRVFICGSALYLAWHLRGVISENWVWLLGGIAVLYNPLIKLSLGSDVWPIANLATIVILALLARAIKLHVA